MQYKGPRSPAKVLDLVLNHCGRVTGRWQCLFSYSLAYSKILLISVCHCHLRLDLAIISTKCFFYLFLIFCVCVKESCFVAHTFLELTVIPCLSLPSTGITCRAHCALLDFVLLIVSSGWNQKIWTN